MRSGTVRSGVVGASLFVAGWMSAQVVGGAWMPLVSPARAAAAVEPDHAAIERTIHALMYGVASVAVDAEVAGLRVNELRDRHAALEKRVAALEAQKPR